MTAGGPGKEMAAAEPGRGSPVPGRCAYFVERKKRFCKMIPASGRRFCGEHGQQEVPGLAGRSSRLPSPAGEDGLLASGEPRRLWEGWGRRISRRPAAGGPGVACPPELVLQQGQERQRLRLPLSPGCAKAVGSAQYLPCHYIVGLFF